MITRADCERLDRDDPLASLSQAFDRPAGDRIYLDANSVGGMPATAPTRLDTLLREEWSAQRRGGWSSGGWLEAPRRLGDKLAPLIGAAPGEALVCDSTSVNLFKLLVGALRLRPGRPVIVSEAGNFPTDLYVAQGVRDLLGQNHALRLIPEDGNPVALLDDSVAVLSMSLVDYRSSLRQDLDAVTAAAHEAGALMLWDLSHAAGAVPVDLNAAGADLAVGCTYKYLSGGPGAPAYLFVAARHQAAMSPVLTGWMGHADQFAFATEYRPAPGIARQLCGTPPVLANAVLETALDIWASADLAAVHAKHRQLSGLLIALLDERCAALGVRVTSPRDHQRQGGHVSISHAGGAALVAALAEQGVVSSYRPPDSIRFGLGALALRHVEIWEAVDRLAGILSDDTWQEHRHDAGSRV